MPIIIGSIVVILCIWGAKIISASLMQGTVNHSLLTGLFSCGFVTGAVFIAVVGYILLNRALNDLVFIFTGKSKK